MKSQTLTFELLHDLKWFDISFESEAPNRNLLMTVYLDGYSLDTPDLQIQHRILYHQIKKQMEKCAAEYWNVKKDQEQVFSKLPNYGSIMDIVNEQIKPQ